MNQQIAKVLYSDLSCHIQILKPGDFSFSFILVGCHGVDFFSGIIKFHGYFLLVYMQTTKQKVKFLQEANDLTGNMQIVQRCQYCIERDGL